MAAGIGSRYGGLKQIDPVGPQEELVIDYSIFDALRAGFDKIVFVIRKDIKETFREKIGKTIEAQVDTAYVFQDLTLVPKGFAVPAERKKPWGTGQAILLCKDEVKTPFVALNADDFYGPTTYQILAQYLSQVPDQKGVHNYCMIGYTLRNTLSEHGHVARGICEATPDGYLADVRERTHIEQFPDGIKYTENGKDWVVLSPDTLVSMNFWGFTRSIFSELEIRFPQFLEQNAANILNAEFFIPEVVGSLVREKKARVKILLTKEKWLGVTYPKDRTRVQAAIRRLVLRGVYPENLWGDTEK
jgi:UTP-glucose-1-phosphate uridylyltransferase